MNRIYNIRKKEKEMLENADSTADIMAEMWGEHVFRPS